MSHRMRLVVPTVLAAVTALGVSTGAMAQAPAVSAPVPRAAPTAATTVPHTAAAAVSGTEPVFLRARLRGSQEVPTPGGPAVGDPDGTARAVIRVQGDVVSFVLTWSRIDAPVGGHIHLGARGSNGGVVIPFFTTPMPDGIDAALGHVTVADPAVIEELIATPRGFYANLHTAEFPGGAVRGQFRDSDPVDLTRVLRAGTLLSVNSGAQEVPSARGPAVGDPDGAATGQVSVSASQLRYSLTWSGLTSPTMAHIHRGAVAVNGPVVVPLFGSEDPVPTTVTAVAGLVPTIDSGLAKRINGDPEAFYTNLHTAEFPGGAVRGQLFRAR